MVAFWPVWGRFRANLSSINFSRRKVIQFMSFVLLFALFCFVEENVRTHSRHAENVTSRVDQIQKVQHDKSPHRSVKILEQNIQANHVGTLFTTCETDFGDVIAGFVDRDSVSLIPIDVFLEACQCYTTVLEGFGGKLLSPLNSDILGNIDKIQRVLQSNPEYKYLQDILNTEIAANQHTGPDTGTQALLWMTRGLRVISQFLKNLLSDGSDSKHDTVTSLVNSYEKFLSMHHSWVVRKFFKASLMMLPPFEDFKTSMIMPDSLEQVKTSGNRNWEQLIEEEVERQGLLYSSEMEGVITIIYDMYAKWNIET